MSGSRRSPRSRLTLLALAALALSGLGFEWEGRLGRLRSMIEHGDAARRLEAVRQLGRRSADEAGDLIVAALEDRDPAVRLEAASAAASARVPQAVPVLLDWMDERDPATRAAAARALGAIADPSAVPALIRALGDARSEVRRAATLALGSMPSGASEVMVPLLGRLDDPEPLVRISAAEVLAMRRDPLAVLPLVARARDEDPEVRVAVMMALGELADDRASMALLQALEDPVIEVELAAIAALGRLRSEESAHALAERARTPGERVARAAIAAMVNLDSEIAEHAIIEGIYRPDLAAVATDVVELRAARDGGHVVELLVRELDEAEHESRIDAIAQLLLRLSETTSIGAASESLVEALELGRGRHVALALGATGDPRALVPLLERLDEADLEVRAASRAALMRWAQAHARTSERVEGRAVDPVVEQLGRCAARREGAEQNEEAPARGQNDCATAERVELIRALAVLGSPRAVPALVARLGSSEAEERVAAIAALGDIGVEHEGSLEGSIAIMRFLDDRDAESRHEAARAIGRAASTEALPGLYARLASSEAIDRHAVLLAIEGVVSRSRLEDPTFTELAGALSPLLEGPDGALRASALSVLAQARDPRAVPTLLDLLERAPPAHRASIAAALGVMDDDAARAALVELAGHEDGAGLVALSHLGDIGGRAELDALLSSAERLRWPHSAAASFALARLARRGVLGAGDADALCALAGATQDPWQRANLGVALAALGRGACARGADPLDWIGPVHAAVVRAAAARWLARASETGAVDESAARAALDRCAAEPLPGPAQRACRDAEMPPLTSRADVMAWSHDGRTVLARTLLALRLPDGSVAITQSDERGRLLFHDVPAGPLVLDLPQRAPLDP